MENKTNKEIIEDTINYYYHHSEKNFKPTKRDLMMGVQIRYPMADMREISKEIDNNDYTKKENIKVIKLNTILDIIPGNFYKNKINDRICCVSSIKNTEVNYMYCIFGPDLKSCLVKDFIENMEYCPHVRSFNDFE